MRISPVVTGIYTVLVCASAMGQSSAKAQVNRPVVSSPGKLMTPKDLQSLPIQAPDRRLAYGTDANQYGELRLPSQSHGGPHPVVVLVHGGCWKAQYATSRDLAPMADALKADGIATWNIEYRRLPQPGSGWPGTYLDVGNAVDYLRSIAAQYKLDLNRVVVVGHSAGGHLTMWVATRQRIAKESALFLANPLPVRGVINLAGTIDMADNIPNMEATCGDTVVTTLLGGTPSNVPGRYREASAINILPLGVPQVLIWGAYDNFVPKAIVEKYVSAAKQAGDSVRFVVIPGVGHFETASPTSSAWPSVHAAIQSLLDGKLPQ
jgi:acetyl esterase/lipase